MKPTIDGAKFGSITIEGEKIEHDIVIRLNGDVEKRKKKLSISRHVLNQLNEEQPPAPPARASRRCSTRGLSARASVFAR